MVAGRVPMAVSPVRAVAARCCSQCEALGTLTRARRIDYAEYLPDWHPYEDYRTSYAARAELGGGVVLTQIHDYDLAWWLFGPCHGRRNRRALSDLEIDVEDTVDARLEGGTIPVRVRQSMRDAAAASHDHRERYAEIGFDRSVGGACRSDDG